MAAKKRALQRPAGAAAVKRIVAALVLAVAACAASAQTVIVYARADAVAADRVRRLTAAYDPVLMDVDLPAGILWRPALALALAQVQTVIVVWSARAAQSSEVGAEWRHAVASGVRVIPIMLDDTPMPGELGARQAIDWRPPVKTP
jgi:hypothetical protein